MCVFDSKTKTICKIFCTSLKGRHKKHVYLTGIFAKKWQEILKRRVVCSLGWTPSHSIHSESSTAFVCRPSYQTPNFLTRLDLPWSIPSTTALHFVPSCKTQKRKYPNLSCQLGYLVEGYQGWGWGFSRMKWTSEKWQHISLKVFYNLFPSFSQLSACKLEELKGVRFR